MLGKALDELSSRTLADIICEATGVEEMSQNVFVQAIHFIHYTTGSLELTRIQS